MVDFFTYLKNVFFLAFKGAWAIVTTLAFITTIVGGIIAHKYPRWESIVKKLLWLIPLIVFVLCLIINIALITPYRMYKDQQREVKNYKDDLDDANNASKETQKEIGRLQIDLESTQKRASELENALIIAQQQSQNINAVNITPVTKQELRTFLESINPEILQRIDTGQNKMHVLMSDSMRAKLIELSKRPDFDKYLKIQKSSAHCIGGAPEAGFIKEREEYGAMVGCILSSKDALQK